MGGPHGQLLSRSDARDNGASMLICQAGAREGAERQGNRAHDGIEPMIIDVMPLALGRQCQGWEPREHLGKVAIRVGIARSVTTDRFLHD